MSDNLHARVPHGNLQDWMEDIRLGNLNLQRVAKSILPSRDAGALPNRDDGLPRIGYDEPGLAEIFDTLLDSGIGRISVGAEDKRFASVYTYDVDVKRRFFFQDDQGVMRVPRYRGQIASTAAAETLRGDDGFFYVDLENNDPYIVLDGADRKLVDTTRDQTIEGNWTFEGTNAFPILGVIATHNVAAGDFTIVGSAGAGAFPINLPAASVLTGRILILKKGDASANAVTVTRAGADTIDGATTVVLANQYEFVGIQSDGADWHIIAFGP